FAGPDGDAELVFLIAAPEGGGKAHLKILSKLARALVRQDFLDALRTASSEEEIVALVSDVVNAEKKAPTSASSGPTEGASTNEASTSEASTSTAKALNIVAVTADRKSTRLNSS